MNIYSILSSKPNNSHYLNRYIRFIEYCKVKNIGLTKKNCYLEAHHICPKAKDLFPEYSSFPDHPWNKILLTARQHFIAHMILWKCYGCSQTLAFKKFIGNQPKQKTSYQKITNKMYESLKIQRSNILSENMMGDKNHFYGKHHSQHTRTKISKTLMSIDKSWRIENSKNAGKGNLGKKKNPETIKNFKKAALSRPKFTCPHCNKIGQFNSMIAYHGDNCKFNSSKSSG